MTDTATLSQFVNRIVHKKAPPSWRMKEWYRLAHQYVGLTIGNPKKPFGADATKQSAHELRVEMMVNYPELKGLHIGELRQRLGLPASAKKTTKK